MAGSGHETEQPTPRPAARVLLLDETDRLLLFATPDFPRPGITLWVPPGGGLNPGESFEAAARREVWEETGLADFELLGCVWHRSHVWRFQGRLYDQRERYFLARCTTFHPTRDNLEAHEVALIDRHHWWPAEEIAASRDYFVPRSLAALLPGLIGGDLPDEPIDCGT